jgi:hypothetical protein
MPHFFAQFSAGSVLLHHFLFPLVLHAHCVGFLQFGTVATMFSHNAYADASQQAVSPVGFAGAGGITR